MGASRRRQGLPCANSEDSHGSLPGLQAVEVCFCSMYGRPTLMVGQRPPWSRAAKQKDPMIPPGGYPETKSARLVCPESFA